MAWGYVFLHLDFNLGGINVLPDWACYALVLHALPGMARAERSALLLQPEVLILDEPTSMLDISVQAQILQILRELRERHGLSYLLITHDCEVTEYLCDRIQPMMAH